MYGKTTIESAKWHFLPINSLIHWKKQKCHKENYGTFNLGRNSSMDEWSKRRGEKKVLLYPLTKKSIARSTNRDMPVASRFASLSLLIDFAHSVNISFTICKVLFSGLSTGL